MLQCNLSSSFQCHCGGCWLSWGATWGQVVSGRAKPHGREWIFLCFTGGEQLSPQCWLLWATQSRAKHDILTFSVTRESLVGKCSVVAETEEAVLCGLPPGTGCESLKQEPESCFCGSAVLFWPGAVKGSAGEGWCALLFSVSC